MEKKINGKFSLFQWSQITGALIVAMTSTWIIITTITGVAVEAKIRKEVLDGGVINEHVQTAIDRHQLVTMETSVNQYMHIMEKLSKIESSMKVCQSQIEELKK